MCATSVWWRNGPRPGTGNAGVRCASVAAWAISTSRRNAGVIHPAGGPPPARTTTPANENRGKKGDAILSLAPRPRPELADAVATLAEFIYSSAPAPTHDAATATLSKDIEADFTKLTGLGKLKGVGDVFVDGGARVAKLGRTTGLTRGRVTAFEIDNVNVNFDLGTLRFDNQIEIEGDGTDPFSGGGDSGSLILGEELRAVALLFAGSDQGGSNGHGVT